VALIIETSKHYGREILLGIARYAHASGPWSVFTSERAQDDPDPAWLRDWAGDGIITRSLDLRACRAARDRGIPVVSLRHLLDRPEFPTLMPDQKLIGKRVATHFLERGLRNFAYVGVAGAKSWDRLRCEAFVRTLHGQGCDNVVLRPMPAEPGLDWEQAEEQIAAWVRRLPRSIGVMVAHDTQGIAILDACRRAGRSVPDDVAVVSVDNDPVLCDVATPTLSSLDQNLRHLGVEAARLLDRMMAGERVPPGNRFVEPGEVSLRQSSNTMAVADEAVVRAVRYLQEHACAGVDIAEVARMVGMSRRALERKFAEQIGRSPLAEVQEARFRRVRQLLLETDYVLPRIAELTGFRYQEYLVRFFKQRTGFSPGVFRRRMRFDVR
jgi:LacI family transcriptional regulator